MAGVRFFPSDCIYRMQNSDCASGCSVKKHFNMLGGLGHHKMLAIVVFLLTVNPAFTGYSWVPQRESKFGLTKSSPEYDEKVPTNVSVLLGQPVYLPCTVYHLGDKLVSWIRTRDLHILTNGKHTFTADQRVDVIPSAEAETWTLRIKSSKLSDSGKYECQVNTDPKMSKFFTLTVRETSLKDFIPQTEVTSTPVKASISGPKEQYVNEGFTVTFECKVAIWAPIDKDRYHPRLMRTSIPTIQWLHDGYAVSFQSERGGIFIETERGEKSGISRLTVASVTYQDAGRYTCTGDGVSADTIILKVIEREHTEAMQRDQSSGASKLHSAFPEISKALRIPWKNYSAILQITFIFLLNLITNSDWIFFMR